MKQNSEGHPMDLSSYRLRRLRRLRLHRIKQTLRFCAMQLPDGPPDISRVKLPQSVVRLVCWECFTTCYVSHLFLKVAKYQEACDKGIPFEEMTVDAIQLFCQFDHPLQIIPVVLRDLDAD